MNIYQSVFKLYQSTDFSPERHSGDQTWCWAVRSEPTTPAVLLRTINWATNLGASPASAISRGEFHKVLAET